MVPPRQSTLMVKVAAEAVFLLMMKIIDAHCCVRVFHTPAAADEGGAAPAFTCTAVFGEARIAWYTLYILTKRNDTDIVI